MKRPPPNPRQHIKMGMAGAVLLLSAAWLTWFFWASPPFDARSHRALGETIASQVVKVRSGQGRVLLIARDTSLAKNPATLAQFEAFSKTLEASGVKLAAAHWMKVDPLRVPAVPPGDFFQIIKQSEASDVIVSLLGPPALSDAQFSKLGKGLPKIIALCAGAVPRQVDLALLFRRGLLQTAVLQRPAPTSTVDARSLSSRERFEREFQLVTTDNLAALTELASTPSSP